MISLMASKDLWQKYFDAIHKKNWEKALAAIAKLADRESKNPQVHLKAGDVLLRMNRSEEAIGAYHKASAIFSRQGFFEKSIAIYKIILRAEPNDKKALNGLDRIVGEFEASKKKTVFEPATPPPVEAEAPAAEMPPPAWGEPVTEAPGWPAQAPKWPTEPSPEPALVLFSSMSEEQNKDFLQRAETHNFNPGETIVEEGDSGDSMYIIKSGSAKVVAHIQGKPLELARLQEGDIFGEVAFLTGRPRTASVIADGPTVLVEVNRFLLEEAIEKNPMLLEELEDFYHKRVKATVKKARESLPPKQPPQDK